MMNNTSEQMALFSLSGSFQRRLPSFIMLKRLSIRLAFETWFADINRIRFARLLAGEYAEYVALFAQFHR